MGDLPLNESSNGPAIVQHALKVDPQPSGPVTLGVRNVPLYALASVRDTQYAKRTTAESLSLACKQVPEETDHDVGSLFESFGAHLGSFLKGLLDRVLLQGAGATPHEVPKCCNLGWGLSTPRVVIAALSGPDEDRRRS